MSQAINPKDYDIHKAGGIILKDRRILVERSRDRSYYQSPGGKIETGESSAQALVRELFEELSITVSETDLDQFGTFCHPAIGHLDKTLCMEVFLVKNWQGEITPTQEVEEILWLSSRIPPGLEIGSIIEKEIIPRLKQMDLID